MSLSFECKISKLNQPVRERWDNVVLFTVISLSQRSIVGIINKFFLYINRMECASLAQRKVYANVKFRVSIIFSNKGWYTVRRIILNLKTKLLTVHF